MSSRARLGVWLALLGAVVLASGCESAIVMQPAVMSAAAGGAPREATLGQQATGRSTAGYVSWIPGGSRWRWVGRIQQGDVWAPVNTVLAAEARDVHEANLVVARGMWVGFYLPVERSFSPLSAPVPINLSNGSGQ